MSINFLLRTSPTFDPCSAFFHFSLPTHVHLTILPSTAISLTTTPFVTFYPLQIPQRLHNSFTVLMEIVTK